MLLITKCNVELSHPNSEPHPNNGGDAQGLPTSQQLSFKLNVNSNYKITPSSGKSLLDEEGNAEHSSCYLSHLTVMFP